MQSVVTGKANILTDANLTPAAKIILLTMIEFNTTKQCEIAKLCNLSKRTVSRQFRRLSGMGYFRNGTKCPYLISEYAESSPEKVTKCPAPIYNQFGGELSKETINLTSQVMAVLCEIDSESKSEIRERQILKAIRKCGHDYIERLKDHVRRYPADKRKSAWALFHAGVRAGDWQMNLCNREQANVDRERKRHAKIKAEPPLAEITELMEKETEQSKAQKRFERLLSGFLSWKQGNEREWKEWAGRIVESNRRNRAFRQSLKNCGINGRVARAVLLNEYELTEHWKEYESR